MTALFVIAWLACGVGAAGIARGEFGRFVSLPEALLVGCALGPIALVCWFVQSGGAPKGWRLK